MESKDKKNTVINRVNGIMLMTLIAALLVLALGIYRSGKKQVKQLPFLGQCTYDTIHKSGSFVLDTVHHTVQDFSFTDQAGKTITKNDFKDKIYVADFFFTTCKSICPIMTAQLKRVVAAYINAPGVMFLSHTVYPEHDSVSVLAEYAKKQNADASRWHFVTGNKKELYDMARISYLLSATTGNGDSTDFVHTQMFALVDRNSHVRGFYNGTDSVEVDKLIADIDVLLNAK